MVQTKWFNGTDDLSDSYFVRRKVFIEEQQIDEKEEFDGSDEKSKILVVYEDDLPVATGRILVDDDGHYCLGRIAVLKQHRGSKYGDLVVRVLIRKAYGLGAHKQYVHAQIRVQGFYEKLGFLPFGDPYDEANIPHISMVHEGDVSGDC